MRKARCLHSSAVLQPCAWRSARLHADFFLWCVGTCFIRANVATGCVWRLGQPGSDQFLMACTAMGAWPVRRPIMYAKYVLCVPLRDTQAPGVQTVRHRC